MITYAGYAGREIDLTNVAITTILADTAVSFMAGFAIFPIVFAYGLDPAQGPGLMFVTLPVAFAQMDAGLVVGTAFFVLLFVSALASAISLLELVVSRPSTPASPARSRHWEAARCASCSAF